MRIAVLPVNRYLHQLHRALSTDLTEVREPRKSTHSLTIVPSKYALTLSLVRWIRFVNVSTR